jgi:hypothetical protein
MDQPSPFLTSKDPLVKAASFTPAEIFQATNLLINSDALIEIF